MSERIKTEDIDVEGEDSELLDDSEVIYDITTYGADFDVEGLVRRIEKDHIFRPHFQRQFVWSHPAASKFVESILLGLPVPSVFLYKDEETGRFLIVDGLQRLTTLYSFMRGFLPDSDRRFKLVNVKEQFKGKTYKDLDPAEQIRFDNTIVHAMIISQSSPKNDRTAILHIFDRLNSYGTPLQPQEIRIAVYDGPLINFIVDLNEFEPWREIFGPIHKRAKDQELILRFLAFYVEEAKYQKPARKFLDDFSENFKNIDGQQCSKLGEIFRNTVIRISDSIGPKAFRLGGPLNVAIFDSFMVAVARYPEANSHQIKSAYEELLTNDEYILAVTKSTSDTRTVEQRMLMARESLNAKGHQG